jgi:hypothetical protein
LDGQTTAVVSGAHVAPREAAAPSPDAQATRLTVQEWCELWLAGYTIHRKTTVAQAHSHVGHIVEAFGDRPLSAVLASDDKAWVAALKSSGMSTRG